MNKKLVILTIPGIGTQEESYSNKLNKALQKHCKNTPLEGNLRVEESLPFGITEIDKNQNALYERLNAANKLGGFLTPRRFTLSAFGDGVTFEHDAARSDSNYKKIHNYMRKTIREMNELISTYDAAKLVIVASSMGAHILSTYIWDADNSRGIFAGNPAKDNENLHNLAYLTTIGCNIPLFVSGLPESKIIAIDRTKRAPTFSWDNYYDKNDVLGWPLKQLSASYTALVQDHQINTGASLGSHVKYWDDANFVKPLKEKLLELFNTL